MKSKSIYICQSCGGESLRWTGQCGHCKAWNTLEESVVHKEPSSGNRAKSWAGRQSTIAKMSEVRPQSYARITTGLPELDRVLGGGLVNGSVTLLGGDPGIGKSTLLLQMAAACGQSLKVLYATGEESPEQVALRAERLGLKDSAVDLVAETEVERIVGFIEATKPQIVVVDSIQTVYTSTLQSAPGTVAQVRECAAHLTRTAKTYGTCLILVGHVTKEGTLAGPRVLEHMVDTVLYFEGDPSSSHRLIRPFKNRFGASSELGIFHMTEQGLEEVADPSSLFMTTHEQPVSGTCILGALEGTRPFLVEVQALVEDSPTPNAKRAASGIDANRLQMLLAVLNKHAGVMAFDQNVYVKLVGGVRIVEPAADLAVLLAVHSSLLNRPLPSGLVVFGEVGLAGELRSVHNAEERLKEAARRGFTKALVPAQCEVRKPPPGIEITKASRIDKALAYVREFKKAA